MGSPIYIIGIGNDGRESLGARALALVEKADLLIGGERHLEFFPGHRAEKMVVKSNLKELVERIQDEKATKQIVVLASGDPNFYGIAKSLMSKLPKDEIEVIPNVSAMQWAFARIKESWDDAAFLSVHGRTMDRLCDVVRANTKIGLFTDEEHSPALIAKTLLQAGITNYRAYVCEDLCGPGERVTETSLEALAELQTSPLNTLILIREARAETPSPRSSVLGPRSSGLPPGIPEEEFHHRKPKKGLITKAEVRVLSLAKLRIQEESILWDIGAGSGSVAIEAAFIARKGAVYAIEKNEEDAELVKLNIEKFGTPNVTILRGTAPDGLETFPDPDAVFVGGSGGFMRAILTVSTSRLKRGGRIVVNAITLENLYEAYTVLKELGWEIEVTLVNVARSKELLDMLAFEALNPIYIITAKRPGE
jgi:precorrin-6Y C5,15-methyltransferase (decarboxylating)